MGGGFSLDTPSVLAFSHVVTTYLITTAMLQFSFNELNFYFSASPTDQCSAGFFCPYYRNALILEKRSRSHVLDQVTRKGGSSTCVSGSQTSLLRTVCVHACWSVVQMKKSISSEFECWFTVTLVRNPVLHNVKENSKHALGSALSSVHSAQIDVTNLSLNHPHLS